MGSTTYEICPKRCNITSDSVDASYPVVFADGTASALTDMEIYTQDAYNVFINPNKKTLSAVGGFFETSDERLKDFGDKVDVDLDKLMKLKKNYFVWKDGDGSSQIGVSAQEIQALYPELVSEGPNGILTVSYDKLSVVALAAIDELHKKNKELEDRIAKLESIVNKLVNNE